MSSRKFLTLLGGIISEGDTWLRQSMLRDYEQQKLEDQESAERLAQAEFKAQMHGKPLDMADLQGKVVVASAYSY